MRFSWPARLVAVPLGNVADHIDVIVNLLAGTLVGVVAGVGIIRQHSRFALLMAGGSLIGSVAGGLLADVTLRGRRGARAGCDPRRQLGEGLAS